MDRIKEVFNSSMVDFRKKLSGYKEKILQKLHLSKEQRKELVERLKVPRFKGVFKKAAHQWMSDTCINFIPTKFAQDSIRVFAEDGCWSFVGRLGGVRNLSLGQGCESV
ncbi:hypothetical protein OSTOST_20642 [Ostertagia ostertagi]